MPSLPNAPGRLDKFSSRPVPLLMLVGVPGSGKSTWAQAFLHDHPDYCGVSTDQIRAELYGHEAVQGDWRQVWQQVWRQWQQGVESIQRGQRTGVLYDATNTRRRYRRQAIATARALGFSEITLIWFDVPLGLSLMRNQQRLRQVPPEVIVEMHRQLRGAPPSLGEDIDHIIRIDGADPL